MYKPDGVNICFWRGEVKNAGSFFAARDVECHELVCGLGYLVFLVFIVEGEREERVYFVSSWVDEDFAKEEKSEVTKRCRACSFLRYSALDTYIYKLARYFLFLILRFEKEIYLWWKIIFKHYHKRLYSGFV